MHEAVWENGDGDMVGLEEEEVEVDLLKGH